MKRFVPLFVLALLAGCGGGGGDEAKAPEAVALVRTAPATLGTAGDAIPVYGAAEAAPGDEHSLTAPSEAIIAAIDAPTGTLVRAGQAIVRLQPSPATRAAFVKAASDTAAADAAYRRAERLRRDGLVSDADVEAARAAASTAHAAGASVRVGVNGLVLRAPVAGVVQGLTGKPGDQIGAGAAIASVAARGAVRARFGVDPAVAQRTRPGQPITISLIAGGREIVTVVSGVDPSVDTTTRLAAIFADIPSGAAIGPGEPLRASVTVGATSTGITIPYAALLDDGGRSYVFVVKNGVARSRDVSPGSSAGETVQILKGLQPGERVVTEGGTALEDAMKVREGDTAPAKGAAGR